MRLDTIEVLAKDLPVDVFLFLPTKKAFFFIDNIDVTDSGQIQVIFEETHSRWHIIEYPPNERCLIVSQYNVSPSTIFDT